MKAANNYCNPSLLSFTLSGRIKEALELSLKVIEYSNDSLQTDYFMRSNQLSDAWYHIAMLHLHMNDTKAAANAACKSFEYNHWYFDRHELTVRLALNSGCSRLREVAYNIADWFIEMSDTPFVIDNSSEDIIKLIEDKVDREKRATKLFEQWDFKKKLSLLKEGKAEPENLFKNIDIMVAKGLDERTILYNKTRLYYEIEAYDKIVNLWKSEDLLRMDNGEIYAKIIVSKIQISDSLGKRLELPKFNSPIHYLKACQIISHYVEDLLLPKKISTAREKLSKNQIKKLKSFLKCLSKDGITLCNDNIKQGIYGSASNKAVYSELIRYYGMSVEFYKKYGMAAEIYKNAFDLFPSQEITELLLSANAKSKHYEKNIECIKTIRTEHKFEEVTDFSILIDTYELKALCELDESGNYLEALRLIKYKNRELFRLGRTVADTDLDHIPYSLRGHISNFSFLLETLDKTLKKLHKKHPENLDIVSELLEVNFYLSETEEDISFGFELSDYLPLLREHAKDASTREQLSRSLLAIGYFTAQLGNFDSEVIPEVVYDGIEIMKEGVNYGTFSLTLGQNFYLQGRYYALLGESQKAIDAFTSAINHLKSSPKLPTYVIENPARMKELELHLIPDLLLARTYCYRAFEWLRSGRSKEAFDLDMNSALHYNTVVPSPSRFI